MSTQNLYGFESRTECKQPGTLAWHVIRFLIDDLAYDEGLLLAVRLANISSRSSGYLSSFLKLINSVILIALCLHNRANHVECLGMAVVRNLRALPINYMYIV